MNTRDLQPKTSLGGALHCPTRATRGTCEGIATMSTAAAAPRAKRAAFIVDLPRALMLLCSVATLGASIALPVYAQAVTDPNLAAPAAKPKFSVRQTQAGNPEQPAASTQANSLPFLELPGGGMVWSTEDPNLGQPLLNFSAARLSAIDGGQIEPISLNIYTNYGAFMERLEISVYSGRDRDLTAAIFTQALDPQALTGTRLQLPAAAAAQLRVGDELQLVVRAFDRAGNFDETFAQVVQLVTPEEREAAQTQARFNADGALRDLSDTEREARELIDANFSDAQGLRRQNIAVYGSNVRIAGQNIDRAYQLQINQVQIPIDQTGKFVVDYLLPVGQHQLTLQWRRGDEQITQQLQADVTGKHLFLVALADITLSDNRISGAVEALSQDDRYDDSLVEGRLAFYLKGKIKGKYLITAHMDTDELPMGNLFDGFFKETPRDIFRRLDPDAYYPVYGDDSVTTRDIDTQGKLYVRLNWAQNEAIVGNYFTGMTGTRYGHYSRSLYGAALNWRSSDSTVLGDAKTQVRVFGAEAQTAYGHSEFLGTGGSLYYLKHTDLLPGSEQLVLETRDRISGNTLSRQTLARGIDYDIDELQGRIILARPLMQVAQEAGGRITRDNPLGENHHILLIDYEYYSRGLIDDDATGGLRARQWFGDHFALGTTLVRENRAAQNYQLTGVDARLQAGVGTYLAVEKNQSEASATRVFISDNGGLSFTPILTPTQRDGDASAVDARVNFQELGYTDRAVRAGAWYRDMDAGFSVSRFDYGQTLREEGAELSAEIIPGLWVNTRYSSAARGATKIEDALVQLETRMRENSRLTAEVRHSRETYNNPGFASQTADGTLLALRYQYRFSPAFEAYLQGQTSVEEDRNYDTNDLVTLGGIYTLNQRANLAAEASQGSRGDAYKISSDYRLSGNHTVYAAYTWSTDTTATYDPLFSSSPDGLTLGQRWRVSDTTNLFNESQWLKSPDNEGVAHTYGMDFYPSTNWTYGFTLQKATLDAMSGEVDRDAYSIRSGYTGLSGSWRSAFEWRDDSGAESRQQWVSSNHASIKYNEDLRFAGRINFSETTDDYQPDASAKFNESNLGFAYRPHQSTRWALLGKYTYLYDRSTLAQTESLAWYDQKSHIVALEGTYEINSKWSLAAKFAERHGQARDARGVGDWYDSQARLYALQARYSLAHQWHALAEIRQLEVDAAGDRQGWLVGVDRNINEHIRLGVGYNFSDFSDDLRRHDFRYEGWFLNLVGYY